MPKPKSPNPRKPSTTVPHGAVIPLKNLDDAEALKPLNFRVPPQFHREYKIYAVQNGMNMVELLRESFELFKRSQGR
jgi:ketopantoate reductase